VEARRHADGQKLTPGNAAAGSFIMLLRIAAAAALLFAAGGAPLCAAAGGAPGDAAATPSDGGGFLVQTGEAPDAKSVFATVESTEVVPARVRTGGTIATIDVRRGDEVRAGAVIAVVGDPKLLLQQKALNAEVAALQAQDAQARSDLGRVAPLVPSGAATRAQRDQLQTQVRVAQNTLQARQAQLQVVAEQLAEGDVLAPTAGRIIDVPFTEGTVVMPGESVATIAVHNFVLRLRVPEEYARFLKAGDTVRVDAESLAPGVAQTGRIDLVYPEISDGRVIADARVDGIGNYFVGQRVRVWLAGGLRRRIVVPEHEIFTRFGIDYARLRTPQGLIDAPVQRGVAAPSAAMPDGIEILSGLHDGDVLAAP
jgi:RND family efflux transporter MFP subunit